jgi:hypothetical protein
MGGKYENRKERNGRNVEKFYGGEGGVNMAFPTIYGPWIIIYP